MSDYIKYLDESLDPKERAADLVSRMSLEEQASMLRYDAPAIERLGIPAYNWWSEGLHGVARAGTATVFPQAIGMAAMFDSKLLREIGNVVSTEFRAKYNEYTAKNDRDIYKGLTAWSPNVNIFRDPRWGRGHETYGEDPFLTGEMGVAYVKGLQGEGKHIKVAACAKHFAVHSGPEAIRHEFDAVISKKEMEETYLPAFERCVKDAKVEAVMGAYNRVNGEPACGSETLLKNILRGKWGFDGHVVSDCWAISDFHMFHKITATAPESAALAIKNGCDVNCGVTYLHLLAALQEGLVEAEDITAAAIHAMTTRIRLGMFDKDCEYDKIPFEVCDCKEHNDFAVKAAEKTMVLLKNDGILPIDPSKLKSVAVIGPNADSRVMLKGNYAGTPSRNITVLDGIREALPEDVRLYYSEGCHLWRGNVENLAGPKDRLTEAVSVAERADVAFVVVGLDASIEGEAGDTGNSEASGDKVTLKLPGNQQELIEAVCATGTPTVVIVCAGSAVYLEAAHNNASAVLDAWYPGGMGGRAVANVLFGKTSPAGKLPLTFYAEGNELPDFCDYRMKNRTYRFIEEEPFYPFGYGLTYSDVHVTGFDCADSIVAGEDMTVSVTAENKGKVDTDEVIELYIKDDSELAVPNFSLCGFERVQLKAGESLTLNMNIPARAFTAVDENGERVYAGNEFTLWAGTSAPDKRSVELMGKAPIEKKVTLKK